jgi:exosome complex RNA-binding protein Csl4
MPNVTVVLPSKIENVLVKIEDFLGQLLEVQLQEEKKDALKKSFSSAWLEKLLKGGVAVGVKGKETEAVDVKRVSRLPSESIISDDKKPQGIFSRLIFGEKKDTQSMIGLLKKIEENTDPDLLNLKKVNEGDAEKTPLAEGDDDDSKSTGFFGMLAALMPHTTAAIKGVITVLKTFGAAIMGIVGLIGKALMGIGSKIFDMVTGRKKDLAKAGSAVAEKVPSKVGEVADKTVKKAVDPVPDATGKKAVDTPIKQERIRDAKGRFVKVEPIATQTAFPKEADPVVNKATKVPAATIDPVTKKPVIPATDAVVNKAPVVGSTDSPIKQERIRDAKGRFVKVEPIATQTAFPKEADPVVNKATKVPAATIDPVVNKATKVPAATIDPVVNKATKVPAATIDPVTKKPVIPATGTVPVAGAPEAQVKQERIRDAKGRFVKVEPIATQTAFPKEADAVVNKATKVGDVSTAKELVDNAPKSTAKAAVPTIDPVTKATIIPKEGVGIVSKVPKVDGVDISAKDANIAKDVVEDTSKSALKSTAKFAGNVLKRVAVPLTVIGAGIDIMSTETDTTKTREQKNVAHAGTGGGLAGAAAGAATGAMLGAFGGPLGMAIGGLIGGVAGSFGGAAAGEKTAEVYYHNKKNKGEVAGGSMDATAAVSPADKDRMAKLAAANNTAGVSPTERSKMAKNLEATNATRTELDSAKKTTATQVNVSNTGGTSVINAQTSVQGGTFSPRQTEGDQILQMYLSGRLN